MLPRPLALLEFKNDSNSGFVSPRQLLRVQSTTAIPPGRRPSENLLNQSPELGHRVTLPPLHSISLPSSVATPSDLGSSKLNAKFLPSIQSALGWFSPSEFPSTQFSGLPPLCPSSSCARSAALTDSPHGQFPPSQIPPSPFPQHLFVSAKEGSKNASPWSQPSWTFWRGCPSPLAPPPPHQPAADTSHYATPYKIPSMTTKSPATSYPTPTESPTPESSKRTSFGSRATSSYKCTHPGCTAPPFKTQHRLKSHTNVHLQVRLYFCDVKGCPHGFDGKGFKRKNELMRHSLVHNSPSYACPFCPDQQHKYPRPDNLQRHVRVRHVDKCKADPILRQILAQRPVGSTRGQQRRMNSG